MENASLEYIDLPTEVKVQKINDLVFLLPVELQQEFCSVCREARGDFLDYSKYMEDAGICDGCLRTTDVVNTTIVQLVKNADLDPHHFYFYLNDDKVYSGARLSIDNHIRGMKKKQEREERKRRLDQNAHEAFKIGIKNKKNLKGLRSIFNWLIQTK